MIDFHGRVAIVTGAGKGLGRSHAQALARRGAAVVVNNRRRPGEVCSADATVAAIQAAGGRAVANYESVDSPGAGKRLVAAALEAFGGLDLVIANAGWSEPVAFHRETAEHTRRMIDINTVSVLDLVRAALPHLRAQKFGRIVVCTSSAALYGDAGFVSYATAKAALIGFVAALAQESARVGVTINALLPFARTPMTDGLFSGDTFPDGTGAVMTPEAVSNVLVYLLSEQCHESGQTWLAGGTVVRKAMTHITPGIVVDRGEITPELVAARVDEIANPTGAVDYPNGAALLTAMAEYSLATP